MFGARPFYRHLEEDEELILVVHKHWLIGVKHLFYPIIAFVVGWVFLYMAPFVSIFYIVSGWEIFCIVWTLRNFYDYYLDAWIITDQGIIDVAWHGWFHRESTRVLYSDIQGVSYEIQGVTSTLMRYGQVAVEKISTGSVISLDYVPRPRKIEALILKNMEKYLHSKKLTDAKHVQDILAAIVAREVQMEDFDDDDEDEDSDDEE